MQLFPLPNFIVHLSQQYPTIILPAAIVLDLRAEFILRRGDCVDFQQTPHLILMMVWIQASLHRLFDFHSFFYIELRAFLRKIRQSTQFSDG